MKKTILYIGGFKLPDKNAAAQRVIGNGKILNELGYNVVYVDISDECTQKILNTKHDVYGSSCFSVMYPNDKKSWIKYLTEIGDIVSVIEEYKNVTAVIAYNYQAFALSRLRKYCRKKKISLIADCTEWHSNTDNVIRNIDSKLRMEIIQPKLDGVIAISSYLYDYYNKKTTTLCLPPLVDLYDGKWKQSEIKKGEHLRFAYAGNPGKHKDKLDQLIEVIYDMNPGRGYLFDVFGITEEQYLDYYPEHSYIIKALKGNIIFHGRVRHELALNYISSADFSVFFRPDTLKTRAGFPTKYVEAVTCGTPVITNKTSDLGDYIKDGENAVLIDGYEKKDIKRAFERVFAMTREEIAAIKAVCKAERDKFDYRNYTDKMNRFIDEVINK